MLFDDVVIPDVGFTCWQRFSCQHIHTEGLPTVYVRVLDLDYRVLWIKARVLGQNTWNDKEGFCEALHSKFGFSRNFSATSELVKVLTCGNFEGTSTRDHSFVLNGVLDSSETVTDSILGLCN